MRFALRVIDDSVTLFSRAVWPLWTVPRLAVAVPVAAVLVFAVVVRHRSAAGSPLRGGLGYWLLTVLGGAIVAGGGYALAIAGGYAGPLSAGIENRVNMVAAIGYVLVGYGVAGLNGQLVASRSRHPALVRSGLPLALAVVVGVGYAAAERTSAANYDRSFATQIRVLDRVREHSPYPPLATIFAFGYPTFTAPGVPTFAWNSDLNSAVKVALDDPSPAAYPVLPGTTFACGATTVTPVTTHLGIPPVGGYGNTYFLDVATGAIQQITDLAPAFQ